MQARLVSSAGKAGRSAGFVSAGKASRKCRQGRQEHFSMTDRIERIAWQRYVKRLHQRLQEPEKLHSGFKPDH